MAITNGFRKTGIYPFDVNAIDLSKTQVAIERASSANLQEDLDIDNRKAASTQTTCEHLIH